MGSPKALLRVGGTTFLERVTTALLDAGLPGVTVVLGHGAPLIRPVIPPDSRIHVTLNPRPEDGQLSSLQCALTRLSAEAVVMALVDVPLITPELVGRLLDAYRRTGAPLVRPVRAGRHGHPVIFSGTLLQALAVADPGKGARPVLAGYRASAVEVAIDEEGPFIDIDTPDEYRAYIDDSAPG